MTGTVDLRGLPFQVGDQLGGGAFSDTWLVPERNAVLKVALPELRSEEGATNGVFFARGVQFNTGSTSRWRPQPSEVLATEAQLLQRVTHPAFVKVLEVGPGNDSHRPWVLLEHIKGVTWREALGSGRRPGLAEFSKLVAALAAARRSGQLDFHGDVKPDNLLITPSGDVRIIDPTGGSVLRDEGGRVISLLTTEWYNPAFLASDVFSLGVLLIETLTRAHPLVTAPGSPRRACGSKLANWLDMALVLGNASPVLQRLGTMTLPREVTSSIPEPVERVALKCMALERTPTGLERVDPFEGPEAIEAALKAL
jgi:serine/threonine protein kinase